MDVKIIHYNKAHKMMFDRRLVMTSKINSFYIHLFCNPPLFYSFLLSFCIPFAATLLKYTNPKLIFLKVFSFILQEVCNFVV